MKKQVCIMIFFLGIFLGLCNFLYAWDNKKTHPALTYEALQVGNNAAKIDNYLKTQLDLTDGVSTELSWDFPADIKERIEEGKAEPEKTTRTILEWLKVGSTIEDEDGREFPIRSRHHFHDPYRNTGLDNKTDHPNWRTYLPAFGTWWNFDFTGESALGWATTGTAEQEPTTNYHKWNCARDEFYKALTDSNESVREESLVKAFLNLGHVLHLIEDMGVPAHARNDFLFAHYRGFYPGGIGNPLETWTEKKIKNNGGNIPSSWLDGWTANAKVFSKLSDYFDTDAYTGQYEGASPPDDWGLAERTNYQFLSKSTIFREDVNNTKYYFPQPDPCNVGNYIDESKWYKRRYATGYGITHLARQKYLDIYAVIHGIDWKDNFTTFDKSIYEDYAKVTIPRTIDYATGLTNYFFRGQLSVEPNWIDPNIVELTITNDSNNSGVPQILKGGVFELYWDDRDGNRAEVNDFAVNGWEPSSTLDYNDTITATFTKQTDAAEYTLVYKGDICENPLDLDADDPNAVAVAVFRPGYPIIAWGRDDYGQVSDVPDGNEFIAIAAGKRHCLALKSDGSLVAWGYNNHGECNVPDGTDFTAITAGTYHSIALKSGGSIVVWGYDNLNQITDKPDGNDFVAVTAGDYHSLALKSDGTIVGWGGWNTYGECDAPDPDPGNVYTAIAAGKYHSLALQSDGVVKAWGNNNDGQTRIYDGAAGKVHKAVAAGYNYSFLLRDDDMLISWGGGDWLEPGIPRYHYRQPDSNDFIAIAAGTDHILGLTSDGRAFDWDWPFGDFPFDYFSRTVPDDIVFIDDISAGYDFSLSLKAPQ